MAHIVSIHSFRGGTGKSNSTANLATCLAVKGRRVGVVDTDIQSPGIHVLFGMDESMIGKALNDYLWGKCDIEEAAYDVGKNLKTPDGQDLSGKVYLIPSALRAGEIARVLREGYDVSLLNDGFRDLVEDLALDFLLIDTHPGLNEETLLSIAISDMLIVIMRPDEQDYQGTVVTVDVARKLDVPYLYLLVNKALSRFDFAQIKARAEAAFECTVATVLPLSEDMVALASAGIFYLKYPEHEWSKGIERVAGLIMSMEG
jgi:MinD-like ATPase involved in chromosome partitioning or flagellar assembly